MIYGYARVSTAGQQKNGYSLEDQCQILKAKGCTEIVTEQYTGSTTNRPKFKELVGTLVPQEDGEFKLEGGKIKKGDTLVVARLDRFARTNIQGCAVVQGLLKRGVTVYVDGIGTLENTVAGRGLLNIFLAFAQMEREMIRERTQAGKAIARTKDGFTEGRPRTPKAQTDHAVQLVEAGNSYRKVAELTGISESTIKRRVRDYRLEHAADAKKEARPKKHNSKRIERPQNWLEVYKLYKGHAITQKEAMKRLGLKRTTFYRLVDEYEGEIKGGAQK